MIAPCPQCGSTHYSRERRPDGYTKCLDCGHKTLSRIWDDIRYCLVQDDDSHWYMTPAYMKEDFNVKMDELADSQGHDCEHCGGGYYDRLDEFERKFGDYRVDGPHRLTFKDPRED